MFETIKKRINGGKMITIEGIPFWKAQLIWLTTTLLNLWVIVGIYGIGWLFGKGFKKGKK